MPAFDVDAELTVTPPLWLVIPLNALVKSEPHPLKAVVAPLEYNIMLPLVAALIAFSCAK